MNDLQTMWLTLIVIIGFARVNYLLTKMLKALEKANADKSK